MADAESDCDAAELIFGELLTNALRHGSGDVVARLEWDGDRGLLRVEDEGHGFGPGAIAPADYDELSGRGLYIVAALTHNDVRVERDRGFAVTVCLPVKRDLNA